MKCSIFQARRNRHASLVKLLAVIALTLLPKSGIAQCRLKLVDQGTGLLARVTAGQSFNVDIKQSSDLQFSSSNSSIIVQGASLQNGLQHKYERTLPYPTQSHSYRAFLRLNGRTCVTNISQVQNNAQFRILAQGDFLTDHPISISVRGPTQYAENATAPNPFLDRRFNLIVRNKSGISKTVPGFFAADDDAAESSANSGKIWKVYFSPNSTGQHSFSVSFRQGSAISIDPNSNAGSPLEIDSVSGSFTIKPSDKTGRDFRAYGRLLANTQGKLVTANSQEPFYAMGLDSAETLLGMHDRDRNGAHTKGFDNTPDVYAAGNIHTSHTFQPHEIDWRPGDPIWKGTHGQGLIGLLNYLSSKGLSVFNFLTYNVDGGDGGNVFPWTQANSKLSFDVSKLAQWEIVTDHANTLGLAFQLLLMEEENDAILNNQQRKLYFREMIAHFSHNSGIIINLGEESRRPFADLNADLQYMRNMNAYPVPLAIHNRVDTTSLFALPVDLLSIQAPVYQQAANFIDSILQNYPSKSFSADEVGPASNGIIQDSSRNAADDLNIRKLWIWPALMKGGSGVRYYFGYSNTENDLSANNFRTYERAFSYLRFAREFFEQKLPGHMMSPCPEVLSQIVGKQFCLGTPKRSVVAAYTESGAIQMSLPNGDYQVEWFNPSIGGNLIPGEHLTVRNSQASWVTPPSGSHDWVAVLRRIYIKPGYMRTPESYTWPIADESEALARGIDQGQISNIVNSISASLGNRQISLGIYGMVGNEAKALYSRNSNTTYPIYSLSKWVTSLLVGASVQAGLTSLDSMIAPGQAFGEGYQSASVRNLLNMTANLNLNCPTNSFAYSNLGFEALGNHLRQVTGLNNARDQLQSLFELVKPGLGQRQTINVSGYAYSGWGGGANLNTDQLAWLAFLSLMNGMVEGGTTGLTQVLSPEIVAGNNHNMIAGMTPCLDGGPNNYRNQHLGTNAMAPNGFSFGSWVIDRESPGKTSSSWGYKNKFVILFRDLGLALVMLFHTNSEVRDYSPQELADLFRPALEAESIEAPDSTSTAKTLVFDSTRSDLRGAGYAVGQGIMQLDITAKRLVAKKPSSVSLEQIYHLPRVLVAFDTLQPNSMIGLQFGSTSSEIYLTGTMLELQRWSNGTWVVNARNSQGLFYQQRLTTETPSTIYAEVYTNGIAWNVGPESGLIPLSAPLQPGQVKLHASMEAGNFILFSHLIIREHSDSITRIQSQKCTLHPCSKVLISVLDQNVVPTIALESLVHSYSMNGQTWSFSGQEHLTYLSLLYPVNIGLNANYFLLGTNPYENIYPVVGIGSVNGDSTIRLRYGKQASIYPNQ